MHPTSEFPGLLRLIEERSNAFRALVAAAPALDVPVPTYVGQGRLRWAAIVAAGPADERPTGTAPSDAVAAPREPEALHAWLAASVDELDTALRGRRTRPRLLDMVG